MTPHDIAALATARAALIAANTGIGEAYKLCEHDGIEDALVAITEAIESAIGRLHQVSERIEDDEAEARGQMLSRWFRPYAAA